MNSKHKNADFSEPLVILKQYQNIETRRQALSLLHVENIEIDKEECLRAGLVFIETENVLICIYCKVKIQPEEIGNSAFSAHSRLNRHCDYIRGYTKRAITENVHVTPEPCIKTKHVSGYEGDDVNKWQTTSIVAFAYETGFSQDVVKLTLLKLKEREQDLNVDNFWDILLAVSDTPTEIPFAENTLLSRNTVHNRDCIEGQHENEISRTGHAHIAHNLGQSHGQKPITKDSKCSDSLYKCAVSDKTLQQSNTTTEDDIDGSTLENHPVYLFNSTDVRPKITISDTKKKSSKGGKTSSASRLPESRSTNDSLAVFVEEDFDQDLSLGLYKSKAPHDGNNDKTKDLVLDLLGPQTSTLPQVPKVKLHRSNALENGDLGFVDTAEDTLYDKCDNSLDDVTIHLVKNKTSSVKTTETTQAAINQLPLNQPDVTISAEIQRGGPNNHRNQPLLTIPNLQHGARPRKYSESSEVTLSTRTNASSEGYGSLQSTMDNSIQTSHTLPTEDTIHEPVKSAGARSTATVPRNTRADSKQCKQGSKVFSAAKAAASNIELGEENNPEIEKEKDVKNSSVKSKGKKAKSAKRKPHKSPVRIEYEKLFRQVMCNSCWQKTANCLYLPCRHLNRCEECSENVENCPKCDGEIIATVKVYFS